MNRMFIMTSIVAGALLSSAIPGAAAQAPVAPSGQVTLRGEVKAEKTVTTNGVSKIQLVEPASVLPGDRLLFTTLYTNAGAVAVSNFVVTNPVPAAVAVAPDSAQTLTVSVDGGKSWGRLAALSLPDGKGGRRAAVAADVTHVRWTIPTIAPGASGKVEYRALVR